MVFTPNISSDVAELTPVETSAGITLRFEFIDIERTINDLNRRKKAAGVDKSSKTMLFELPDRAHKSILFV